MISKNVAAAANVLLALALMAAGTAAASGVLNGVGIGILVATIVMWLSY